MKKLLCIMGESASGKTTLAKMLEEECGIKQIVSHTSRPKREGEVEGVDYYFVSDEDFVLALNNDKLCECLIFNEWYYGISVDEIEKGSEDDIKSVVVTPQGMEQLVHTVGKDKVVPIYIFVDGKSRLIRSLAREQNGEVGEMCRRYLADEEDFKEIEKFSPTVIPNYNLQDAYKLLIDLIAKL